MAARAAPPPVVLAATITINAGMSGGTMSHCTMATCVAHRRSVYVNIQDMEWVHADGWPCDAMLYALISPQDLE